MLSPESIERVTDLWIDKRGYIDIDRYDRDEWVALVWEVAYIIDTVRAFEVGS